MSGKKSTGREPGVLDLPDTVDLASVSAAEIAVIQMAARRDIDVREALAFSRMLDHRRRAIADVSFEEKLDWVIAARKARGQKP